MWSIVMCFLKQGISSSVAKLKMLKRMHFVHMYAYAVLVY